MRTPELPHRFNRPADSDTGNRSLSHACRSSTWERPAVEASVNPESAFWLADLGEFVLPYAAVRTADSPESTCSLPSSRARTLRQRTWRTGTARPWSGSPASGPCREPDRSRPAGPACMVRLPGWRRQPCRKYRQSRHLWNRDGEAATKPTEGRIVASVDLFPAW